MSSDHPAPRSNPFRITPGSLTPYAHDGFAEALAYLQYVVDNREGLFLLTGAPGTGKTSLIHAAVDYYRHSLVRLVSVSCNPVTPDALLQEIAEAWGATVKTHGEHALGTLRQLLRVSSARNLHNVLVLDEVQVLSDAGLEQLRLLTNLEFDGKPLLQVLLIGQEEFRATIAAQRHEPLRQRIVASASLQVLDAAHSAQYIRHRWQIGAAEGEALPFDDAALEQIHAVSGGIPRCINQICGRALLMARVENIDRLGTEELRRVAAELEREGLLPAGRSAFHAT